LRAGLLAAEADACLSVWLLRRNVLKGREVVVDVPGNKLMNELGISNTSASVMTAPAL